jgi:hypothetical protein
MMTTTARVSRYLAWAVFSWAVVFAAVDAASAQPLAGSAASVEWEAANCCYIVRAVIDDVAVHELPDGLHGHAGIHRYETVSVRVLETLRGPTANRLQFVEDGDWGIHGLAQLRQNKQEVLLFLEPWSRSSRFRRASGGYAYTRFPYVVRNVLILGPRAPQWAFTSVPVLSDFMTRLSDSAQVLDTVRTFLKNYDDHVPLRTAMTKLPPDLRGGYYMVTFRATLRHEAAGQDGANRESASQAILDFEKFKDRFAKAVPTNKKPPYLRNRGGYIGVHALEWMAADCDTVVRGVIEEACFVSRIDDPTGDHYGVRFQVLETIRGAAAKEITCFVRDARDLETLRRDKQELVLFLRSNRDQGIAYPEGALQYRLRARLWDDSAIILNKDAAEVLFADLSWHHEPNEIVARLRAVSQNPTKPDNALPSPPCRMEAEPPMLHVHPPGNLVAGSSIAGNPYAVVFLPVDSELESNARKWAASSDKNLRWLAARALIYFKSDKNATILKRLLDDSAAWDRREMLVMTELAYPFEPRLLVRWEAWHVLAGWGYNPPDMTF